MFNKKITLTLTAALFSTSTFAANSTESQLTALEKSMNGKIGAYAIDTNTHQVISYRGNEKLPIQSTFKVMGSNRKNCS